MDRATSRSRLVNTFTGSPLCQGHTRRRDPVEGKADGNSFLKELKPRWGGRLPEKVTSGQRPWASRRTTLRTRKWEGGREAGLRGVKGVPRVGLL